MIYKAGLGLIMVAVFAKVSFGQNNLVGADRNKTIVTAVPFLGITPDARHGAMGDAGVATSPDANSAFWNAGKLGFIDKDYGASVNYTPWLTNLGVNDIFLSNLQGFYKLRKQDAIAMSFTYFALGKIGFRDVVGNTIQDFNPAELALSATYSRTLTDELGLGVTGRFIHSNIAGSFSNQVGQQAKPANTVAVDVGTYYNREIAIGGNPSKIAFGAQVSNFGPQVSYSDNNRRDFIPTNLKIGGALTTEIDQYNKFTFTLDMNKLLVPTPGPRADSTLLGGFFQSFTYAPGGVSEKLSEIIYNTGVEYWYDNTFAVRAGYFHENREKGNRQYMTFGFGVKYQKIGLDFAYVVAQQSNHPLNNTLRFGMTFDFMKPTLKEESVTD